MDRNPAKFFDGILNYLSTDYNKTFTIDEIIAKIYKKNIKNNAKSSSGLDGLLADKYYKSNVINAVMFLHSQDLISYDEKDQTVFINTKGFVKIKTEGFVKEIRNKKVNLWLQRFSWFGAILAVSITVYVQFFKD